MDIKLADTAGFCFGVRRAINMALKKAREMNERIYTIGPIIHNPQMVEKLREKNVYVVENIDDLNPGDTVIIRSHGIEIEDLKLLKERKMNIIDATCPFVKNAQKHAAELSRDGYKVIVVGEKNHPEVIGILSFTNNEAVVINHNNTNVDYDFLDENRKIGVVAQTTTRPECLDKVVCKILHRSEEIKIFNTICFTTVRRQEEAKQLAEQVDAMVIVGGYNSANTTRLATICREMGKKTFHIETAAELDKDDFTNIKKIGVTAGASTPDWIIENVIEKLKQFNT